MPPYLGLGLAGVGALGSLFGNNGANYAQANQYQGDQLGAIQGEGVDANTFGQLGQQDINSYNQYNPLYQQAVGNEANYLNQNLYTNPYSNQALTNAAGGTTNAYNAARANLTSSLAQRGLQSAGDSSASGALAGGLASINQAQAGTVAGAQQGIAQQSIAQHAQNLQSLDQLYGGVANQYYNQGTQAYGQQAGIQGNMAGQYGQMAQSALQQANMAAQAQQAPWNSLMSAGMSLYGMSQGPYGGGSTTSKGTSTGTSTLPNGQAYGPPSFTSNYPTTPSGAPAQGPPSFTTNYPTPVVF